MIEHANSFATIVGLLSAFVSSRQNTHQAELNDFTAWLNEHHHEQLTKLIETNSATSVSIKALLNQQIPQIKDQLNGISSILSALASRIDGFAELALSTGNLPEISAQGYSLLEQMCKNEVTYFLIVETFEGTDLVPNNGSLQIQEPMFLKDDLATLLQLSLLRLDHNRSGEEIYYITRLAHKVIIQNS